MVSWERPAVVQLIHLYEQHTSLYDLQSPLYHNKQKRTESLQAIADGLAEIRPGTTKEDVKTKINGLRTQYMAEKSKQWKYLKNGMAAEYSYIPTLWCYKNLHFLDKHTSSRKGNISIQPTTFQQTQVATWESSEDIEGEDQNSDYVEVPVQEVKFSVPSPVASSSGSASVQDNNEVYPSAPPMSKEKKEADKRASAKELVFVVKTSSEESKLTELDHFGGLVARQLAEIENDRKRRRVMLDIQHLINDAIDDL